MTSAHDRRELHRALVVDVVLLRQAVDGNGDGDGRHAAAALVEHYA
ncbi:hypothetical protein ABZW44_29255 [Streptomyces mirabilis]